MALVNNLLTANKYHEPLNDIAASKIISRLVDIFLACLLRDIFGTFRCNYFASDKYRLECINGEF
jgi:hypothetical protein